MKFSIFRRNRRRASVGNASILNEHEAMVDPSISSDSDTSTTRRNQSSRKKHRLSRQERQQRQRHRHLHRQNYPYGALPESINDGIDGDLEGNIINKNDRQHYNEYRVAELGRPQKRLLQRKERMTFKIHDFAECPEKRGEFKISPTLHAHGYNWKLQVYPRGDNRSKKNTEYVSCFLHYFFSPNDKEAPVAKIGYHCGSHRTQTQICTFAVQKGNSSTSWGLENFLRRDRVLDHHLDEDGALVIHIDIRLAIDPKIVWYPPSMRREPTLMQLYHTSEETGDVMFRLNGSMASFCYRAHKMILALRAKILYEIVNEESSCSEVDLDSSFVIVDLPGVDRDVFEAMLEHIYTVKQPTIEDEVTAQKLLVAADRFCLTDLKLYVESVMVDRFLTTENAASFLLLGDAHSCALLKETSMDLYVSDPDSVVRSSGWVMLDQSERILAELLAHTHTSCRNCFYEDKKKIIGNMQDANNNRNDQEEIDAPSVCTNDVDDAMNRLDVFSLREQLCEKGLDVDGSRETLVARLKESQQEAEERE